MTDIEYLKKYLNPNELENGIKRLENGEPVQYIVGNVSFYGFSFDVNNSVLIPRFETEELVSRTINLIKKYFNKEISILDIGTGSGCIAITLNKLLSAKVDAVDISSDALKVATKNGIKNNSSVNFFVSDVFSNVKDKYDVIISNPPYIKEDEEIMDIVKNNEPHIALYGGKDGLYFYDKILKDAKKYLNKTSIIAFEIGCSEALEIRGLANKYLDNPEVIIENDYNGLDRFVFIIQR